MEKLLTQEEKRYLKRITNYLRSLGMKYGEIEFEMDVYDGEIRYQDINWDFITHFSNNYGADIPSGLIPIIQKIVKYADDKGLYSNVAPSEDDMTWQKFEISIDCINRDITLYHYWSFYSRGDSSSDVWDGDEGKEIFDEWDKETNLEIPEDGILSVNYNGSGDSGYLEGEFEETGESVPNIIENWCYRQLENIHGGWEINEGSDGRFTFDFINKIITLEHTYNSEESSSDTLWEESFGGNEKE